jgi:uncharacterized protein YjbI with pentapeptide repeats
MIRTALILTIMALLLVAPGDTVGEALAADPSDPGPTTEAQPPPPEAVDDMTAAPAEEPSILSWAYWQQGGGGASRSEIFRNFGLLVLALIGLGFGVWRAWTAHRQANVAEQGNFTERFSTAVEHLGSPELPVRLGGIHALWRLAKDSPKRDVTSVIDILCAFVRNPPHVSVDPPEPRVVELDQVMAAAGDDASPAEKLRPDVQTVVDLIGDKEAEYRRHLPPNYRLDLSGADLHGANLGLANLEGADLRVADLIGADLVGAKLTGAILMAANLEGARLSVANLTGATLTIAKLTHANLTHAALTGATLVGAKLMSANLTNAKLADADLTGADLTDADLMDADLTGADLGHSNLTGANLTGADFEGAVSIPNLSLACADPNHPPKGLPEDVKRPEPWKPCPEKSEELD